MADIIKSRWFRIFKAMIYSYMITAIFLIVAAILITYSDLGIEKEKTIITIGIIMSTFLSGFDTARGEKRNGWKWGIFGALIYGVIYVFIGILITKSVPVFSINMLAIVCVMICSGAVGGMLGINIRK